MITLNSADNVLKSVYLDVVAEQLNNNTNPLFSRIKQTTSDIYGKEIIKVAPYGINGGIGAGTETGTLPTPKGNNYVKFTTTLKNLYGTIEISDKAIRSTENDIGTFVNLLNSEMEGLLKASKFNFSRMLYGNGTGKLATLTEEVDLDNVTIIVDSTKNLMEGMVVDIYSDANVLTVQGATILSIDRANGRVLMDKNCSGVDEDYYLVVQGSKDLEITGLGAIISTSATLYGVTRSTNQFMNPIIKTSTSIKDSVIQEVIDDLDEIYNSQVNFITCASNVKRFYLDYLAKIQRNVDIMDIDSGIKAISYNGIPLVSDRFIKNGEMYLLNTNDFNVHQLCDWKWLESDSGKILKQNNNTATYKATLVKYADLICDKPCGQAKIKGITQAGTV